MLHSRGRHAVLLWHGDDPDVSFLDHLDAFCARVCAEVQELPAQKFVEILPHENQRRTQHYVLVGRKEFKDLK